MDAAQFRRLYPNVRLLCADDLESLTQHLRQMGVYGDDEIALIASRAGDGNMNATLRVRSATRSLVVKQSRPWVEKYPEIAAPWDRVLSESRFYQLVSAYPRVAGRMPRMLETDPSSRVLVLEDLGEAIDYTDLYVGRALAVEDAVALADWLAELHNLPFHPKSCASLPNRDMRRLNHEHLFRFPLDPANGLDLDSLTIGLTGLARELAADRDYTARVAELGRGYLRDGACLLHGDFFPGSWLRTGTGPAIVDPEFAFFGAAEFDVGVMLAHLHLAEQPTHVHDAVVAAYRTSSEFQWELAIAYCGVEIMRRLIGVAQTAAVLDLDSKRRLLELSRRMVVDPVAVDAPGLATARQAQSGIGVAGSDSLLA